MTNRDITVHHASTALASRDLPTYEQLCDAAVQHLSARSRRVYRVTFRQWAAWCLDNGHSPLVCDPKVVKPFLLDVAKSHASMMRMLSTLRTLARTIAEQIPQEEKFERVAARLTNTKPPKVAATADERKGPAGRALTDVEVNAVLSVWGLNGSLMDARNGALLRLLFYAGLRRFEVAGVAWTDVDFESGVLSVYGKGRENASEADYVPIVSDVAIDYLRRWKERLDAAGGTRYVMPTFTPQAKLAGGRIHGQRVWEIVKHASELSGVHFTPHDARRTAITSLLNNDVPLHDVQTFARHKDGQTTMRYARSRDAAQIRKHMKVGY